MSERTIGRYRLVEQRGTFPDAYPDWVRRARLAETFDADAKEGDLFVVAVFPVASPAEPLLVVAQCFSPFSAGFEPGALLVPETGVLFVGAGTRALPTPSTGRSGFGWTAPTWGSGSGRGTATTC